MQLVIHSGVCVGGGGGGAVYSEVVWSFDSTS